MRGVPSLLPLLLLATAPAAHAQLRPRRVGTSALGETQEVPEVPGGNVPAAGGDDMMGGDTMASMLEQMASGGGLADLANNPMLKGLADSNPELAKMMADPEALQKQMGQVAQMMQSDEGKEMAGKMMEEMQSVLTDPEKLQAGLEQLTTNPALKGLADSIPGLRDVLSDPEAMQEQAKKTAEIFQKMNDPDAMKEMLGQMGSAGGLGGMEGLADAVKAMQQDPEALTKGIKAMQQMMQGAGGADSDALADLLGGGGMEGLGGDGDGTDLKDRVAQQMARMMQQRGGGGGAFDEEEAAHLAADIDEF